MVTDEELKLRAQRVQDAEAKLYQAHTFRDALITQAVGEGRKQADVAGLVGLTPMMVSKIVRRVRADGALAVTT